jgi:hypothetical protein
VKKCITLPNIKMEITNESNCFSEFEKSRNGFVLNIGDYSSLQKCCPQSEWRVFATTFAVSFFPQREWQNFATRGAVKSCQLSAREKMKKKLTVPQ